MATSDLTVAALAQLAGRCTLETLPDDVVRQAKLCILDTIGCMIAGHRTTEVSMVLQAASTRGVQKGTRGAPVIGTDGSLDPTEAAMVNGYAGDILELNDLIGGHASIGNVTAALACAADRKSTGRVLLESVVRGIEVTSRIYSRIYPTLKPFGEAGLVPVGLPSSVGAAAVASHICDLNGGQTKEAMAIAASLAGWCPAQVIFRQGGTVKPMLFGAQPAMTGISAVNYALAGMTGPAEVLDGEFGYYATVSQPTNAHKKGGRAHWALARPVRKLHACCGYIHSTIDAIYTLSGKVKRKLSDYRLVIELPPYVHAAVSKQQPPATPNEARFDLGYCAALAVNGESVILPQHSLALEKYLGLAQTQQTRARIVMRSNPALEHYRQCIVTAQAIDNQDICRLEFDTPRGGIDHALSDAEVIEKFRRLVSHAMAGSQIDDYVKRMMSLEDSEHIDWIGALAQPGQ